MHEQSNKNSLKPIDLVKIIQAGKECGVAEIKWHGLHITFIPNYNNTTLQEQPIFNAGSPRAMVRPEADLDELMRSDPLAYEEAITSGQQSQDEENS